MAEPQGEYVSRGGLKLASVADTLRLDFSGMVVLDVGSSTGGFTDYVLQHGARKVIAVDAGTDQLHPSLRDHARIELHEQTDIRAITRLSETPDIVVIDVSFISLREILPAVSRLSGPNTQIIAMCKPQFEVRGTEQKHHGIIKNDRIRRDILRGFETWAQRSFVVVDKADSAVHGVHGNQERFYTLRRRVTSSTHYPN
jgi:23S rRNA (cytidine1920-2'-O)/16S rRNA (cytidine1409-2'-O)-methyltransferase